MWCLLEVELKWKVVSQVCTLGMVLELVLIEIVVGAYYFFFCICFDELISFSSKKKKSHVVNLFRSESWQCAVRVSSAFGLKLVHGGLCACWCPMHSTQLFLFIGNNLKFLIVSTFYARAPLSQQWCVLSFHDKLILLENMTVTFAFVILDGTHISTNLYTGIKKYRLIHIPESLGKTVEFLVIRHWLPEKGEAIPL